MGQNRIVSIFLIFFLSILSITLEMAAAGAYSISNESNVTNIRSITQTADGYLWILAGQGVLRFDGVEFESFPLESGNQDDHELYFHKGRSGGLWIVTDKGFWKYSDDRFTYVAKEDVGTEHDIVNQEYSADYGLSSGQTQAVIEDRKGFIWKGTKFGLVRIHKTPSGLIHTENYLKNADVLSLFEDKEGNIWVGTRTSGLKCLKEKVFTTYSVSNSAASSHFTSLLEDSQGRIWAGTRYGDLYRFKDGHFERISLEPDIFDNIMFTIEEDNQGRILLGTEYRGVHVYENGKTQPYMTEDGPVTGTIVTLFSDSRNRLWVGQYTKELGFYDNGRYNRFLTSREYPGKMVFSIIEDKRQNLWIGGTSGVIFLPGGSADKKNMRWLLKDTSVHSLFEDDSGMIWCGTSENGLIRIHPDTFATVMITEDEGLWTNYVFHILQDNRRNLWLITYQRIMRIPLDELNALSENKREKVDCIVFGLSDGLPPPGLSGLVTKEDHLLFATHNGIAEVDPEAVSVNLVPPSVLVHEIMLNGHPLKRGEEKEGPLTIKSRSHLEIQFKVISFKGQENIQAKYRLNGLENDWTSLPLEQDKIATFTGLKPGHYTFQIVASNNHGIWNSEGDYLTFQVIPSFFQTIYFKLVVLLIILTGAGLLSLHVHKRTQKKKNKYRKTRLSEDLAEQYRQKLLFLLEEEKIYRDSSLSIQALSRKLSLPAHHLSQVINEKFNMNFYELVNGYRIEESKGILIAGDKDQPKILAIALDVGFNNLSSFNRAFKRHTGKTPTEFKNGRQNQVAN